MGSSLLRKSKNHTLQLCRYNDKFNPGWIHYYVFIFIFLFPLSFEKSLKLKHFHGPLKVPRARNTVPDVCGDTLALCVLPLGDGAENFVTGMGS